MGMTMKRTIVAVALVACTRHNPDVCNSDADCKQNDPAKPFCDVDMQFGAPTLNTCIPMPANCPPERCGCTPGAASCTMDELVVCNADALSATTTPCGLGCAMDGTRCLTFQPTNDLGGALMDAMNEPAITLPPGVHIDTGSGAVTDASGNTIAVRSELVMQGGSAIRAFLAKSFVVDSVVVTGPNAFALVAPGTVSIVGMIRARATGAANGPGASTSSVCSGTASHETTCSGGAPRAVGAGGGGNATQGGAGGGGNFSPSGGTAGGLALQSFVPLIGGCSGGNVFDVSNSLLDAGGGGGGAVQIVSLQSITFQNVGWIDVGGGGGSASGGGGAGGMVVLEAPVVAFSGSLTGLTANGGAGGGCGSSGPDGGPGLSAAMGPSCNPDSAGNGGLGTVLPSSGATCAGGGGSCLVLCGERAGGGGGAAGRLRIATSDGGFALAGAQLSAGLTTVKLVPQ